MERSSRSGHQKALESEAGPTHSLHQLCSPQIGQFVRVRADCPSLFQLSERFLESSNPISPKMRQIALPIALRQSARLLATYLGSLPYSQRRFCFSGRVPCLRPPLEIEKIPVVAVCLSSPSTLDIYNNTALVEKRFKTQLSADTQTIMASLTDECGKPIYTQKKFVSRPEER